MAGIAGGDAVTHAAQPAGIESGNAGLTQQPRMACDQLPSRPSAACQHPLQLGHPLADALLTEDKAIVDVQEPLESRLLVEAAQFLQEPQPCRDENRGPACG
jgi:hypothetical protein